MNAKHKLREAIDSLYTHGRATTETYTRLVLDCVRQNDIHQAKRLQSHLDIYLEEPTTTFIHNRLLQLYTKSGHLSDARNLFDKLSQRDIFTYNAMLSGYCKLGSVDDLQVFFDGMPCRDSVSYNTVISGLASNGCCKEALKVFVRMQKEGFDFTDYTLVSVLNACSRVLGLRFGKEIHGRIVVCGFGGNVFVWNALVDMYAKCGQIEQARWLFDRMVNKNVVSWNLMISGYMKHGKPDECIGLFREMKVSGLKPDQVTVSNILGAFLRIGNIEGAEKLFAEIKEKDKVSWTTMIVGYVQNNMEEDALTLFGQMLSENIKADNFTISSIVSCCARLASFYHGQVVHGKAVHMGVDNDLLVSSALVDMYSKCGEITDAWTVFTAVPSKNVITWNSMIIGYAHNGMDIVALDLYEEMLQQNLKPDNVTFVGVLSACMHAGLTEQGQRYFDSIRKIHGMTPTLDHYACVINLLGRSGSVDKAVALIEDMEHTPNSLIWSTLLSVCKMCSDIENGEIAAKHLFELDPFNAEPYVMLSNMYATAGRWKDVASIRSLMKNKKVKKFAAYSWIETGGKFYKFVSEDRSHPESKAIYLQLNKLIRKLQEAGFIPDRSLVLHNVGEDEKFEAICYHSEKLALAFGLIKNPQVRQPIRILKNIRICGDCHVFMKFVSKIIKRPIILRDSNRFHHFVGGQCSCKDLW